MEIIKEMPQMKKPTAVAVGFFDGMHLGHRAVISRAVSFESEGLVPVVFTFSQDTLKRVKKTEGYIINDRLKYEELSRLGVKTMIMPDFETVRNLEPEEFVADILLRRLMAKAVVCGFNYRFGLGGRGDTKLLEKLCVQHGVGCVVVDPVTADGEMVSSSKIREYLKSGEVEKVNRLLPQGYCFDFKVCEGARLGRELGFPTINQMYKDGYVHPRYGVYMSSAEIDGKRYPAVTNIGVKPTVSEEKRPSAETHILGIDQDLYGENIKVRLLRFLRDEQKFSSLSELKSAVLENIEFVKSEYDKAAKGFFD